jgi:uncharacterized protein (TIGR02246 family)
MPDPAAHDAAHPSADLLAIAYLLVESWNREDARAFAGLFTPAAEYVTTAGERLAGRNAISQLIGMAKPVIQVRLLGQPSCSAGQLSFAWVAVEPGKARSGRITCTCVRHESGWLIEALHNDLD